MNIVLARRRTTATTTRSLTDIAAEHDRKNQDRDAPEGRVARRPVLQERRHRKHVNHGGYLHLTAWAP